MFKRTKVSTYVTNIITGERTLGSIDYFWPKFMAKLYCYGVHLSGLQFGFHYFTAVIDE